MEVVERAAAGRSWPGIPGWTTAVGLLEMAGMADTAPWVPVQPILVILPIEIDVANAEDIVASSKSLG